MFGVFVFSASCYYIMKAVLRQLSHSWLNANLIGTLPIFFATNLAAIVIWSFQISQHTMPLMLGIIAAGLSDLDNRLTGRLTNLLFTLLAFAISSLSAELALLHGWLFVPLMTLITFGVIMLGAIGQRYSTIAFGSLLVAVYTTLSYTPTAQWYTGTLLILLGTLIYGMVAVVVYLLFPNRTVQENVAQFYEALGRYLQLKSEFFDPDETEHLAAKNLALAAINAEVMLALDKARVSLFYRLRGQHRHLRTQKMLRYFFTGQDIWERAGSSHSDYKVLFQTLQNSDLVFRLQRILELQADACRQIAAALRHNEAYRYDSRCSRAVSGLQQSLQFHQSLDSALRQPIQLIAQNLRNIDGQLAQLADDNAAPLGKTMPKTPRLIAENISGFGNMLRAIRLQCHFGSGLFRHAVRLSIVVFLSGLLVELFQLTQGYWILLTAVLVCQPNYSATKKRLIQRMVGTVLGVIVGLSLRYLSPTLEAQLGIIVACSSLFFLFRTNNYSFSTFFVTIQVLVSFDVIGLGADMAMLPRIIDTLIGVGLAWWAVSFLWPDWKYLNLRRGIQEVLNHNAHYLRHITAQLQFGYRDSFAYRIARRSVHHALAELSTVVSNMTTEPQKYRQTLAVAPNLLGISYALMSYISALGAYRVSHSAINQRSEVSAYFFKQAKRVATILNQIADGKETGNEIAALQSTLQTFENAQATARDEGDGILYRQLQLIAQQLPQLAALLQQSDNTA